MPKHRQSKKYRDGEAYTDDTELRGCGEESDLDSSSEEEITVIHENRKQRAKRVARHVVERVKEEPKCRSVLFRYCLFLVVLSLGVGMVVNLYGTYGEYVTDAIFPPRTSSAGVLCPTEDSIVLSNDYMVTYHHFEDYNETEPATKFTGEGWAVLNATKPKESLVMAWTTADPTQDGSDVDEPPTPLQQMVDIHWQAQNTFKVWMPAQNKCVAFIVWSI